MMKRERVRREEGIGEKSSGWRGDRGVWRVGWVVFIKELFFVDIIKALLKRKDG